MERKRSEHKRIKQECSSKEQTNAGKQLSQLFHSYAAAPRRTNVFRNQCKNSKDPQRKPCTQFRSYERSDTVIILSDDDTSSSSHGVMSLEEVDSRYMEACTPCRTCKARLALCYDSDSSDELTRNIPPSCKKMKEAAQTSKGREPPKRQQFVYGLLHSQCLSEDVRNACWHNWQRHEEQSPSMVPSGSDNDKDDEIYMKICKPEVAEFRELQKLHTSAGKKAETSKVRGFGKSGKKIQKKKEYKSYTCSVCNESLSKGEVLQHPILAVSICQRCKDFHSTCHFNTDKDGFEGECAWCGDGGELVCCDHCTKVFCQPCIKDNFGNNGLHQVLHSDSLWLCYVCNPKPLEYLTQQLQRARTEIYKSQVQTYHALESGSKNPGCLYADDRRL